MELKKNRNFLVLHLLLTRNDYLRNIETLINISN